MKFTQVIATAILAFTAIAAPTAPEPSTTATLWVDVPSPVPVSSQTSTKSATSVAVTSPASSKKATSVAVAFPTSSKSAASVAVASPAPSKSAASEAVSTHNGMSLTQQLFIADTAVDRFALLKDADMKFNFAASSKKGKGGKEGDIIAANRKTFPALVGTGAGMAVGFLNPCAFNTPHVHPRSVELQIVTKGSLVVEMMPENGVQDLADKTKRRVIRNTVAVNEMTPFYLGSVHTQFNPDCSPAEFVASFTSEDFGTGEIADELFALDADIVSAAFGQAIDGAHVDQFKHAIPVTIAKGVEKCLAKCHIKKRSL